MEIATLIIEGILSIFAILFFIGWVNTRKSLKDENELLKQQNKRLELLLTIACGGLSIKLENPHEEIKRGKA